MAVQLLEQYQTYQARVHPRGPGMTKCFSVRVHGDVRARELAERWVADHERPKPDAPAVSYRAVSGLRGIHFKWERRRRTPALYVLGDISPGVSVSRSVHTHGLEVAFLSVVTAREAAGHPLAPEEALVNALTVLRRMRRRKS